MVNNEEEKFYYDSAFLYYRYTYDNKGLMSSRPVGLGVVVGVGIGYGIYRLSAGEKADILINTYFGYRKKP